jgi:hypothetical protein
VLLAPVGAVRSRCSRPVRPPCVLRPAGWSHRLRRVHRGPGALLAPAGTVPSSKGHRQLSPAFAALTLWRCLSAESGSVKVIEAVGSAR